ncbi:hypothetical protein CBR_g52003 [Chara braunii]|uniref:Malectin-like domain-containing protein n=1 Tax=Chara braunii TaxID=69332 RepID=A0A388K6Y0_CHABU|nr:hypothetical protein CBR_g52003 [Chara braunii]|eukprot:GBG65703.1 hypothetical protein CBR_g52003 [Chara braunii]
MGGERSLRHQHMMGGRSGLRLAIISGVFRREVAGIATLRKSSPPPFLLVFQLMAFIGIATFLSFGVERGLGQQMVPSALGRSHIRINCGGLPTNDSLGPWEDDAPLIISGDSTSQGFPEINSSNPLASYRQFGNRGGQYHVTVNASAYYRVQLLFLFRKNETMAQEKIVQVSIQGHEGESIPRWLGAPGFNLTVFDLGMFDGNLKLYVSEYVFFCDSTNLSIALGPAEPAGIVLPRVSVIYIWELADGASVLQNQMMGKDVMLMTWCRQNCGGQWIRDSEGHLWEGDSGAPVENSTVSLTSPQSFAVQTNDTLIDTQYPWVPPDVWATARISAPRTYIDYSVNLDQAERYFLALYVAPMPDQGVPVQSQLLLISTFRSSTQQISRTVNVREMVLRPIPRVDTKLELEIRLGGKNPSDHAWISGLEVIRVIPMKGLTLEAEVQALGEIMNYTGGVLEPADPCIPPSANVFNITCGSTSGGVFTPIGL